jgi:hypothetical protein
MNSSHLILESASFRGRMTILPTMHGTIGDAPDYARMDHIIHAVQVFLHKNGTLVAEPPRVFRSALIAQSAARKYSAWFPAVVAWSRIDSSAQVRADKTRILYRAGDIPRDFIPA